MRIALNHRSVRTGLLLVFLLVGMLAVSEQAQAANRTVIGELFSADG